MKPVSVLIPAAKILKPIEQGDFDNLCGLCSIVNAIQIAAYPAEQLNRSVLRALFRVGIDTLAQQGVLPAVLRRGIDEAPWLMLASALVDDADFVAGVPIMKRWIIPTNAKRITSRDTIHRIKRELQQHRPVLTVLWSEASHSTVIVGYTATRFILFDSSGHRWVQIRSCGIDHVHSNKRHRISAASALSLSLSLSANEPSR